MRWETALRKLSSASWGKASMTSDISHPSVEEAETSATSAFGSARLPLPAEHAVDVGAASLRQGRSHIGALISKTVAAVPSLVEPVCRIVVEAM
jgi:hypothetical protein